MEYEWDAAKAAENRYRHGIDFVDAIPALEDPNRLEEIDTRLEYGEERIQVIGAAIGNVLFVVTTLRGDTICRIISARRATRHEQDRYYADDSQAREAPPRGDTHRAQVNAKTDEEVLAAARSDLDAQPLEPEELAKMRRISPVKALRQRLGMTQIGFAEAFGLPVSTLRDWEQRRTTPDAPARALLKAIEREPETMQRLLSNAA